MTPMQIRLGRYQVEWTAEHLRVTMAGSPWSDALLLGVGLGGGLTLFTLAPFLMGWKAGWWLPLLFAPSSLLLGWMGYRNGVRFRDFAIEAFLTGARSVWVRLQGQPKMVAAQDIEGFEVEKIVFESEEGGESTCYGVEMKTVRGPIRLLPAAIACPKPHCEALCGILNALALGRGSVQNALAGSRKVHTRERIAVIVLSALLLIVAGWLVYFFALRPEARPHGRSPSSPVRPDPSPR